jgi:uncharacterized surface protein with fasciclin (FAS1) repeats
MKKLVVLLFVAALGFSCGGDDETPVVTPPVVPTPLKSIAQIVIDDENFSTLEKALGRAELGGVKLDKVLAAAGTYTVFAPNNKAFDNFLGSRTIESIPVPELTNVLLNHVFVTIKKKADLKTDYYNTLADGAREGTGVPFKMSMFVDNTANGIILNGFNPKFLPKVLSSDINASNGVVHIVDNVILLPSVVEAAIANPNLSTLVKVLTSTVENKNGFGDQSKVLQALTDVKSDAPVTVFAPLNTAFASSFITPTTTQEAISSVLYYHVAAKNTLAAAFTDKPLVINTLLADKTISIVKKGNDVIITDASTRTSDVKAANIQCTNGVVHAISAVLNPSL